jgi:hypothetical protein
MIQDIIGFSDRKLIDFVEEMVGYRPKGAHGFPSHFNLSQGVAAAGFSNSFLYVPNTAYLLIGRVEYLVESDFANLVSGTQPVSLSCLARLSGSVNYDSFVDAAKHMSGNKSIRGEWSGFFNGFQLMVNNPSDQAINVRVGFSFIGRKLAFDNKNFQVSGGNTNMPVVRFS